MTARRDWNECVLVIKSEAVRGAAVGCIAWLDDSRALGDVRSSSVVQR